MRQRCMAHRLVLIERSRSCCVQLHWPGYVASRCRYTPGWGVVLKRSAGPNGAWFGLLPSGTKTFGAMPVALHLTFNRAGAQGAELAKDLQRCNKRDEEAWEHRVVELEVVGNRLGLVDLASTHSSLPELETALHLAKEVHLHGNDVDSILREVPYIKPEALAQTPLFVHGPCKRNKIADPDSKLTYFKNWPGPVFYDLAASLSLKVAEQEGAMGPDLLPIDPWSHLLSPRQGPTGPIEGLAQDNAVIVCLSRNIEASVRKSIGEQVEALFSACEASVDVGWIDESKLSASVARRHRRLAQLFVTSSWSDPGCLEAMAACTPFWVMDEEGETALGPWLESLGVDPAQHRMSPPSDPKFEQEWQTAVDLWATGGSLPAELKYRQAVIDRCLASLA